MPAVVANLRHYCPARFPGETTRVQNSQSFTVQTGHLAYKDKGWGTSPPLCSVCPWWQYYDVTCGSDGHPWPCDIVIELPPVE